MTNQFYSYTKFHAMTPIKSNLCNSEKSTKYSMIMDTRECVSFITSTEIDV